MKPYRYILLTEEDHNVVTKGYQFGVTHHFRQRCHGLLLSHEGKTIPEIATLFNKRRETIHQWFNRWEIDRIRGLDIKTGRGRKPVLNTNSPEWVEDIKKSKRSTD